MDTLRTAGFGVGTILALLILQRVLQRVLRSSGATEARALGASPARALREVGDVVGVLLLGAAVVRDCARGEDLGRDALMVAAYGAAGLALLELTGALGERLLLGRRARAALDRGNVATGLALGAHHVAVGVITSRAVVGSDLRGLGLAAVFFALGIATHQAVVAAFRAVTAYDDAEQIEGENVAAAVSYAGASISVAIVVARALEGDFEGWSKALVGFFALSACAVGLVLVRQLVVQGIVLGRAPVFRGGALDEAVGRERNVGVAALEAGSLVGAALAVAVLA